MAYRVYMVENYVLRYDRKNERPWIICTITAVAVSHP